MNADQENWQTIFLRGFQIRRIRVYPRLIHAFYCTTSVSIADPSPHVYRSRFCSQRLREVARAVPEFELIFLQLGVRDVDVHLAIGAVAVLVRGGISDQIL